MSTKLSFCDIGANLLDERYTDGIYHGKKRHEGDMKAVLERSRQAGVTHLILTAGTVEESKQAIQWVRDLRQSQAKNTESPPLTVACTVGVHPTRCSQEFSADHNPDDPALMELKTLLQDGVSDGSVVAIGEIGLDYDRLEFCDKDTQQFYLKRQLETLSVTQDQLPLFLHNRNVGTDLMGILQQHETPLRGVIHSFDDSIELAQQFINMGYYIGLNGCSLKTAENLEVVKQLPLNKILLETDCPYCEVKATHAGYQYLQQEPPDGVQLVWPKRPEKKFQQGTMVKGRNEPCQIIQVAQVIASVQGVSLQEVGDTCFQNSMDLFFRTK